MSATNGIVRPKLSAMSLVVGILLGGLPGGVGGLMWHNWQLRSLENRFNVAVTRFDALKLAFEREVERERDEDDRLERGIADAKQALARLEGSLPLKLPAISEFIEQDKHLNVQDGRLDGMDRRLAAMCGQLAGISAANAKKAGC
jgi:hypothetical protein